MDNIVVVKVVTPEESLSQGIDGEIISAYTIKLIFDKMKKTYMAKLVVKFYSNKMRN